MKQFRYAALAEELTARIQDGTFRTGERLPSVRALKRQRRLSTATVVRALEEMERRGLIEARPRSGFFVRSQCPLKTPQVSRRLDPPRAATLHALTESIVQSTSQPGLAPFGGAVLSAELLPLTALARHQREVLRRAPDAFARYSDAAGLDELRRAIVRRMMDYGVPSRPEDVVITSGCMDAMRLSLLAVAQPGSLVAVETPTFFGMLQLVRDLGMRAVQIPVDPESGLDLDHLERALCSRRIEALIVTPNFQNPLGALMPDAHKQCLVQLARRHSFAVIESDVYGDLQHASTRPRPLAAFDDGRAVLHCSSFSKTLAPGLRLGWVAPGRHVDRVRSLKLSGTICSPIISQLMMERFLSGGAYERHLRATRIAIARQVAQVRQLVGRAFPEGTRVTSPKGGFLLWAQLPAGCDSERLFFAAQSAKITVLPGIVCALGARFRSCVRLNCGHPLDPGLERDLFRLGALAAKA